MNKNHPFLILLAAVFLFTTLLSGIFSTSSAIAETTQAPVETAIEVPVLTETPDPDLSASETAAPPELTDEPNLEATPEPASEHAAEPKPEDSLTPMPEVSPEPGSEVTVEPMPELTPELTTEPAPELSPEPSSEVNTEVTPELTPEPTLELGLMLEATPEPTPEPTPENTAEPSPEPTPESTPHPSLWVAEVQPPSCTVEEGINNDFCYLLYGRYFKTSMTPWVNNQQTHTAVPADGYYWAASIEFDGVNYGGTNLPITFTTYDKGNVKVITPPSPTIEYVDGETRGFLVLPQVEGVCYRRGNPDAICQTGRFMINPGTGTPKEFPVYAEPSNPNLYGFPEGMSVPHLFKPTVTRTWEYHCSYTGGVGKYMVSLESPQYAEDRELPENLRFAGLEHTAEQKAYCKALPEPYSGADYAFDFYDAEGLVFTCGKGVNGSSWGYPSDYQVWVRWDVHGNPPGPTFTYPVNQNWSMLKPQGSRTVSVRIIRPDGSHLERLRDDSRQALCGPGETRNKITPSQDCDGFSFQAWNLLRSDNTARLIWEELNGTVHETDLDILANNGLHSVNSSTWRKAAFVLIYYTGQEIGRTEIEVDMQVCHTKSDPIPFTAPVCGPNNDQILAEASDGLTVEVGGWVDNQATVTYTSTDHKLFSNGLTVHSVTLTDSNEPCPTPQPTAEPTPTGPAVSPTPTVTATPPAPQATDAPDPSPTPTKQPIWIPQTGDSGSGLFYGGLALFLAAAGIFAFRSARRSEDQ